MYVLIEKSGASLRISETDVLASSCRPSSPKVEARLTCGARKSAVRLIVALNARIPKGQVVSVLRLSVAGSCR